MASPAQVNYVTSLAAQRDLTNADEILLAWLNTPLALANANNKEVNLLLEALKALPVKSHIVAPTDPTHPAQVAQAEVDKLAASGGKTELQLLEEATRPGRYFIVMDGPDGKEEKFYKIDKPSPPSRWTGYTFIAAQGGDYFYPVKNIQSKIAILKAIAKDPVNAMNEYGIRLGVCGNCGRTLTAVDSRLRGIGPICADRMFEEGLIGQATPEQLDWLDKLGLRKNTENGD